MQLLKMLVCDLCMDAAVLISVQLSFGRPSLKRFITALLCLQLSTISYIGFGEFMRHPFFTLPFCLIASYFLIVPRQFSRYLTCTICVFLAPATAAGMMALCGNGFCIFACAVFVLIPLLMRRRMHISYRWNIDVLLEDDGHELLFRALIDTGNKLKEPLSGLPVLIVSSEVLHQDLLAEKQFRYLKYGVLGSSGELPAFRGHSVRIRQFCGDFTAVPDCYIAVYPGKIPGGLQALAPPEFTEILDPISIKRHIMRRRKHLCRFPVSGNRFTVL